MDAPSMLCDCAGVRAIQFLIQKKAALNWIEASYLRDSWYLQNVIIRFGSAHYTTRVWINGREVGDHSGGHLPFEIELGHVLDFRKENNITVALNNTLTP